MAALIFKTGPERAVLHFPWGLFGAGYIEHSSRRIRQIYRVTGVLFLGLYPAIIVVFVKFGTEYVFRPLTPLWLCHICVTKWLIRGLSKTDEEKNLSMEVYAEQYSKLGTELLVFVKWGCILLMLFALWMFSDGEYWYTGAVFLVFSGYAFAVNSAGLREKRRHNYAA